MSAYSIFLFGFRLVGIIKTSRLFFLRYPAPKLSTLSRQLVSLLLRFWVDDWLKMTQQKESKALGIKDFSLFPRKAFLGSTPVFKTGIKNKRSQDWPLSLFCSFSRNYFSILSFCIAVRSPSVTCIIYIPAGILLTSSLIPAAVAALLPVCIIRPVISVTLYL